MKAVALLHLVGQWRGALVGQWPGPPGALAGMEGQGWLGGVGVQAGGT